eukprot:118405-Amphidinium_carterae.1
MSVIVSCETTGGTRPVDAAPVVGCASGWSSSRKSRRDFRRSRKRGGPGWRASPKRTPRYDTCQMMRHTILRSWTDGRAALTVAL